MTSNAELQGVEIEFWADWYDGPVSGVATHDGQAYWFEPPEGFDPASTGRRLFLYPLTASELEAERGLHRLYEDGARGKPVEEWPPVLLERDWELPSEYATRESVGWFIHRL